MPQVRVVLAVVLIVVAALVLPNAPLNRSEFLWQTLAASEPATQMAILGRIQGLSPEDVDIVVMGSSVAAVNVSEHMLSRFTGQKVLNAGVLARPITSTCMSIDDVLALEPKTLILVTGPRAFSDPDLSTNSPFNARIAWETYGVRGLLRGDVLSASLGQVSTLYRLRGIPRRIWEGTFEGDGILPENRPTWERKAFRRIGRNAARTLREEPVVPNGATSRAVQSMIALAEEQGVRVFLVPAPNHPIVFAVPQQYYRETHVAELARIADTTSATLIGVEQFPEWTGELFRDPTHLGKPGQRAFTESIAAALR